jgi:hypothetical protein
LSLRRRGVKRISLLAIALLGVAGPGRLARADTIVLENGSRLDGKILRETKTEVVLERTSGGGVATLTIPKSMVKSIERDVPIGSPPPTFPKPGKEPVEPGAPAVRDESSLLRDDRGTVGTRRLVAAKTPEGWRLEERLRFFATPRLAAVSIQRIEDVDDGFAPRHLHYHESGDSAGAGSGPGYERLRTGPVEGGVWKVTERTGRAGVVEEGGGAGGASLDVTLPPGTKGPLGAREALLRASPRTQGLSDVSVVDLAKGEVRTVRAGFAVVGASSTDPETDRRESVLRWEDAGRALDARFRRDVPFDEAIAPGIVAVPATAAQVDAAVAAAERKAPTATEGGARPVVVAECGFSLTVPGASWTSRVTPPPPGGTAAGEPAVVARLESRLLVADVRVEWEKAGRGGGESPPPAPPAARPEDVEAALLARLRPLCPDLEVVEARRPARDVPGAWRLSLAGTRQGERIRTEVLVAERGGARVTCLASCSKAAWDDARGALESILDSFRWM